MAVENPLSRPNMNVTPGSFGDFAKVLQLIVVEDVNTRRFYTTDGQFMGEYRAPEGKTNVELDAEVYAALPNNDSCSDEGRVPSEKANETQHPCFSR